jgi:archaellum component FlaF (FlaF/FlaG flagellin family)
MASWSSRRKLNYASIVIGGIILIVGLPAFLLLYKAPTCSDGKQNQGEGGIDCGGPCVKLCSSAFLPPEVIWTKFEPVAPGLYNVAAYVINRNPTGAAYDVPYEMQLFDAEGVLITTKDGTATVPPNRNTILFQGAVSTNKRIPAKAVVTDSFAVAAEQLWTKQTDKLGNLAIADKKYSEDQNSSSLQVTLQDNAVTPYRNLSVYVVLYDGQGNAIDFSKTIIDSVPANGGSVIAPFTWPVSHNGKVVSIEVLPVLESQITQ